MDIIKAIIAKATTGTTIITNYAQILESLGDLFIINVPMPLISALVKEQLANMSGWDVLTFSTYGEGIYGEVYSVPGTTVYVLEPNMGSVEKATKIIDMVMAGEMLTQDQINAM